MTELEQQKIERLENDIILLMKGSFKAYEISGADTNGDTKWHCSPEWSTISLIDAIIALRKAYDEVLEEIAILKGS